MSGAGHFADRLAAAVERKGAPLCIGIDPDPALMPVGLALVKTSNPGSADVQDLLLEDGRPLWQHVAGLVDRWGADHIGEGGLSSVGAVVGATHPEVLETVRSLMPRAVLLLPGVGAQGGRLEELAAAF